MWGSPSGLPPGFRPALPGRGERLQSTTKIGRVRVAMPSNEIWASIVADEEPLIYPKVNENTWTPPSRN
jgi:hypothetical protein